MAGKEPAVTHEVKRVVEIKSRGYATRWVSECVCGWSSLLCFTDGQAEERWEEHVRSTVGSEARVGDMPVVRARISPSALGT